jgi:hypothetical protein
MQDTDKNMIDEILNEKLTNTQEVYLHPQVSDAQREAVKLTINRIEENYNFRPCFSVTHVTYFWSWSRGVTKW